MKNLDGIPLFRVSWGNGTTFIVAGIDEANKLRTLHEQEDARIKPYFG